MSESLNEKVQQILDKVSKEKKRDVWDVFQITSSFIITLLLAAVTTITAYLNYKTSEFQKETQQQQMEIQKIESEVKREELKLTKLKTLSDYIQLMNKDSSVRNYFLSQNNESLPIDIASILKFVNTNNKTTSPADTSDTKMRYFAQKHIAGDSQYNDHKMAWVWLGQRIGKDKHWKPNNFNLSAVPTPNTAITASTAVWKRSAVPVQNPNDPNDWQLGTATGVVGEGKTVNVIKTVSLEDDNWWALVR